MNIGATKEIKDNTETRFALTPFWVEKLTDDGHKVSIQKNSGVKSGIKDIDFKNSGAKILNSAKEVLEDAELWVKIKEPQKKEYKHFRKDLAIFGYLHPAAPENKNLVLAALKSQGTFIAYETIKLGDSFPLLEPMSRIAGRLAVDYGISFLKSPHGIKNKIPEHVLVIGGGTVGSSAARAAMGLGISTTILEKSSWKRPYIRVELTPYRPLERMLKVLDSTKENLLENLKEADIVIGSVYISGERADRIITNEMLDDVEEGTVFVDVAIDQGGCFEFSKITTLKKPAFKVKNASGKEMIVLGVPNMPAAVGATATKKLCDETGNYIVEYANEGIDIILKNSLFKEGVNICNGYITCEPVAKAHGLEGYYKPLAEVLES